MHQQQQRSVVHFDETGQRAQAHLRWLHVAGTKTLTWYFTHDQRGQLAMDDAQILPGFKGVAVHDGLASNCPDDWFWFKPRHASHLLYG